MFGVKNMKEKIITLKKYTCGKERFEFDELFVNSPCKSETLPINVYRLEHRKYGNILINTGCSKAMKKNAAAYAKYREKHNIALEKGDNIVSQLKEEGFDPLLIKKVLLSHTEPECCGGLTVLPKYEIISTAQVLTVMIMALPEEGVIKSTMPNPAVEKKAAGLYNGETVLRNYFKWVFDALGDGSVLCVDLSGHCKSMTGFFIPERNFFFAADAAPDIRFLSENVLPTEKMLSMQYDPNDYISSLITLKHLHRDHPDINIEFLHS